MVDYVLYKLKSADARLLRIPRETLSESLEIIRAAYGDPFRVFDYVGRFKAMNLPGALMDIGGLVEAGSSGWRSSALQDLFVINAGIADLRADRNAVAELAELEGVRGELERQLWPHRYRI